MRKAKIYPFTPDQRTSQLELKAERALIKKAVDGERQAFCEIVEENKQQMFRVAQGVLDDVSLAEDAVQESFIKAYKALPAFKGESRLSTWLYRIAYLTAIDLRRRQKRHLRLATDTLEPELVVDRSSTARVDSGIEAKGIRTQVNQALEELSEFERIVFSLRHDRQLKLREIATVVDRSEGTVKSALFRAIQKLRECLAQEHASLQGNERC